MTGEWTPELRLHENGGRCRLILAGVTYGNGDTLQEAGNDLLARLFDLATGLYSGQTRVNSALGRPDARVLEFLWELGETVAKGGDIRPRVLGIPAQRGPID
jgi:hypothetical protein